MENNKTEKYKATVTKWKFISIFLFIVIGVQFLKNINNHTVDNIYEIKDENIQGLVNNVDTQNIGEIETNSIADGIYEFQIITIIRTDFSLVDDQYFAELTTKDRVSGSIILEFSEDVIIKNKENEILSLSKFREIIRSLAKDAKPNSESYRITIKDNLIEKIQQIN